MFLISTIEHDSGHKIISEISDEQLHYPTKFLEPLDNDKVEAQYLFSDSAINTTISILNDFGLK